MLTANFVAIMDDKKRGQDLLLEQAKLILASNMRRLRATRKWSQERLADEATLHRTYVGALERGEQNASLESLAKIAEALKVSIWQLLAPIEEIERLVKELEKPN
ncbi:MAG: transcriptional regulator Xre family [bacterium]|nr:MAG: transcriptional regulator Xre family [bacterium]